MRNDDGGLVNFENKTAMLLSVQWNFVETYERVIAIIDSGENGNSPRERSVLYSQSRADEQIFFASFS